MLAQELSFEGRLERALLVLDSTETERGVDSLRALLRQAGPETASRSLVRAHLHLAAASWALGLRDSALHHLGAMVRLNPFAVPDPDLFNPEIQTAYRQARRITPALAIRLPGDTSLSAEPDRYLVALAVGEPRSVVLTVETTGPSEAAVLEVQTHVDSTMTLPLALLGGTREPLESGVYRIRVKAPPGLEAVQLVRVSRSPVDTVPWEPAPDSGLFRPEMRRGPPALWSAVAGVLLGAAAAALPSAIANSDIPSKPTVSAGLGMGLGMVAGGIAGVFFGRRDVLIPENQQFNRRLVEAWQARNEAIAQENARRRQRAPMRIWVMSQ